MQIIIIAIAASFICFGQFANASIGSLDLQAPVVQNRASLTGAAAGQILYDNSAGAFFGLPVGAAPQTASNWVQLSPPQGLNTLVSAGSDRTERLSIATACTANPCTITSQSGNWVSSVTRTGTGVYTINIANGIFSGPPVCLMFPQSISALRLAAPNGVTMNTVGVGIFNLAGAVADDGFNVICQGPR